MHDALRTDTDLNAGILPIMRLVSKNGSNYLEYALTRPVELQGILYTPQTTAELKTWPQNSTEIEDPVPLPVNNLDGTETVTYRRAQAVDESGKAFIRVDVSETSP